MQVIVFLSKFAIDEGSLIESHRHYCYIPSPCTPYFVFEGSVCSPEAPYCAGCRVLEVIGNLRDFVKTNG